MGVVNLGLIRGTTIGYSRGIMIVVGHGICSPFIFLLSFWIYQWSHSRLLANNGRMWALIWLISLNMGLPPCLRLWSEVFMAVTVLSFVRSALPVLLVIFFISATYNLYLYVSCQKWTPNKWDPSLFQVIFISYSSFLCLDFFLLYHIVFCLVSPPVNWEKKKQSYNIDKMSISGSSLKTEVVVSRVMRHHVPHTHDDEKDGPDQDMSPMEACCQIKNPTVNTIRHAKWTVFVLQILKIWEKTSKKDSIV